MSPAQRKRYRGTLWPNACEVQGWKVSDELRRRAVLVEATGQDTSTGLTQRQITALFDRLKWLADPYNLDKAMPVANEELAAEKHERAQLVWRIRDRAKKKAFNEAYLESAFAHKCAAHKVKTWPELPPAELLACSMTVESWSRRSKKAAAQAEPDPF